MHCFGDSSQGSKETAELVESILKDQLNHIFELLCEIATNRDSTKIGIKEFLILLRWDYVLFEICNWNLFCSFHYSATCLLSDRRSPVKLRRFCQYLQVSDIKKTFNSGENITDTGVLNSSEPFEIHVESKQLRSALLFLWHIDPSGYLASIADPTKYCPLNDESLKERQQRMEVMTKSMDVDQYLEYSKVTLTKIHIFNLIISYQIYRQNKTPSKEVYLHKSLRNGFWKTNQHLCWPWLPEHGRYLGMLHTKL